MLATPRSRSSALLPAVLVLDISLCLFSSLSKDINPRLGPTLSALFFAALSIIAAVAFCVYGGRLYFMLRRFPVESRGRRAKLREVGSGARASAICMRATAPLRATLSARHLLGSNFLPPPLLSAPAVTLVCTAAFTVRAVANAVSALGPELFRLDVPEHPLLNATYYVVAEALPGEPGPWGIRQCWPRAAVARPWAAREPGATLPARSGHRVVHPPETAAPPAAAPGVPGHGGRVCCGRGHVAGRFLCLLGGGAGPGGGAWGGRGAGAAAGGGRGQVRPWQRSAKRRGVLVGSPTLRRLLAGPQGGIGARRGVEAARGTESGVTCRHGGTESASAIEAQRLPKRPAVMLLLAGRRGAPGWCVLSTRYLLLPPHHCWIPQRGTRGAAM